MSNAYFIIQKWTRERQEEDQFVELDAYGEEVGEVEDLDVVTSGNWVDTITKVINSVDVEAREEAKKNAPEWEPAQPYCRFEIVEERENEIFRPMYLVYDKQTDLFMDYWNQANKEGYPTRKIAEAVMEHLISITPGANE